MSRAHAQPFSHNANHPTCGCRQGGDVSVTWELKVVFPKAQPRSVKRSAWVKPAAPGSLILTLALPWTCFRDNPRLCVKDTDQVTVEAAHLRSPRVVQSQLCRSVPLPARTVVLVSTASSTCPRRPHMEPSSRCVDEAGRGAGGPRQLLLRADASC